MTNRPTLSIVIVSYNTKELLLNCLYSLKKVVNETSFETLISDNGSTDGTELALQNKEFDNLSLKFIKNKRNLGFSKGNNVARKIARGKYILFLNPDTLVHPGALAKSIEYLQKDARVGALTCKVQLPDGTLDKDTRRRFPTPWIALTHFGYLDRLFKGSTVFDRYWYSSVPDTTTHEVEAIQGAFFLSPKSVLDEVKWFDEDYFLDGEDIDLCYKIWKKGYTIVYYHEVSITHIKKGSKSKNKSVRSVVGGVEAMKLFYKKRLWSRYPLIVNYLVIAGITLMKWVRIGKYYLS